MGAAHCSRCHEIIPEQDIPRSQRESSLVCPSCQQDDGQTSDDGSGNTFGVAALALAGAALFALSAPASDERAPHPCIQPGAPRGKVPQVRDQGMIDITDRHALLIGNSDYQGTLRDAVLAQSLDRDRDTTRREKGLKRASAAGAPATQKKNRKGALVGDILSNALVVDDESEAEGAESSLDAAAPRHMQSEPYVSQFASKSCKSLQPLFKSDKARVFVDFNSFERSQAIHLQVEEILDGKVLREAEDFADLISPVFRVVLQGASGGKVTDGQTVDLIVELEEFANKLNTDSLVFIKKSDELDSMWCGVSGGTFDLVPSESGKGLLLRARVATDSFSWWGIAKCHVKVAAHHIESDGRRKLRFIVYSGAPVGSYPIPRNMDEVRKDPASSRNTLVPMLRGFFMYQHSQKREEVVLRDGLDFTIQVQEKKNGVVKSSSGKWCHGSSIDWTTVEIDVHDIDLDSELEVKISRKSMIGCFFGSRFGIREFTLKSTNLKQKFLPRECETCTSLGYWCNLDEYTGPQRSITCGYCLSCNEEQSEEVWVKGIGGKIKLGRCCKIVRSELMGQLSTSADAESETRGGKVPQVRDQGMIDITDRHALLRATTRDETTASVKETAYSMLKTLFDDNRLSYDVCEKVRLHFNVKCIEDLSYLKDRGIAKLGLPVVDCRKLEKLVQEVRSPSFKKPAKTHAEMPGNVDAEIPDSVRPKALLRARFGDGRRVALCIGIDDYPGNQRLQNCVADAEDMRNCCEHQLGFHVARVLTNPNRRDILQALRELRAVMEDGSLLFFFFSGHGVEHEGVNYLLPLGMESTRVEDHEDQAVSLDLIMNKFRKGTAVDCNIVNVMLLDCCRENADTKIFKSTKGGDSASGFGKSITKSLRSTSTNAEFLVGLACDPGTQALANDDARNSRYTEALLRHLPVTGRQLEESMKEVSKDVYNKTQKRQRPWTHNCLHQSVVLVPR